MQDRTLKALALLAVEYWRLKRLCEHVLAEQPPEKQAKGAAQLRYGMSQVKTLLDENGLRLYAYDGTEYEPNLPVTVINQEDVVGMKSLLVESTIEPTIISNGEVLTMGKVILRKGKGA